MKVPNEIQVFLHCRKCLKELPQDSSPREWARHEVGWSKAGLQIWCTRHEINVLHVNFEGAQHPAAVTALVDSKAVQDGALIWEEEE